MASLCQQRKRKASSKSKSRDHMSYLHACLALRKRNMLTVRSLIILLLSCIAFKLACCFSSSISSLKTLHLVGHLEFEDVHYASTDFGNIYQLLPLAVLHPKSVSDVASTIRHIWMMGPHSQLTVAARGRAHSLKGQAQTRHGVVINMESLKAQKLQVHTGDALAPYIDVSGGELDFAAFSRDQERLISTHNKFDYIEGFVIINRTELLSSWKLSFTPEDPLQASQFKSDGRTLYCLELAKYFKLENKDIINQEVKESLSELSYISSTLFSSEVSYVEFLDRVHVSEIKMRSKGQWEVPHPWLNLLVPRSKIKEFAKGVFGNILTDTSNGPVIVYPVNKSKWDNRTSVVTPEEEIFYLVAILTSAIPGSSGEDGAEHILMRNKRIIEFGEAEGLGVKQYLPHYTTKKEWRSHFGPKWEAFIRRKMRYDPLAMLAPGQRIFEKAVSYS